MRGSRLTLTQSVLWGASCLILTSSLLSGFALTSILVERVQETELKELTSLILAEGELGREKIQSWIVKNGAKAQLLEFASYLSPAHPMGEPLSSPPLASSFPDHAQSSIILQSYLGSRSWFSLSGLSSPRMIELSVPARGLSRVAGARLSPRWVLRVVYPSFLRELWMILSEQWLILGAQSVILACFALFLINRSLIRPLSQLSSAAILLPQQDRVHPKSLKLNQLDLKLAPQEVHTLKQSLEYAITTIEAERNALSFAYQRLASQERSLTSDYLSAQMMHEIGNPLSSVMGLVEFLTDEESNEHRLELLQLAHQELLRIRAISKRSLKPAQQSSKRLDVSELLSWIELILRHHETYHDVSFLITGERSGMGMLPLNIVQSALLNLVLNGARAQNAQGELWLHLQIEDCSLTGPQNSTLAIYLSDQGPGVPSELIDHLFKPWMSSSEGGVGLGLAISHSSIEQSGGVLEYLPLEDSRRQSLLGQTEESSRFHGACFMILCPLNAYSDSNHQ